MRRAAAAESVEIAVLMIPERTDKPFALPRRVRTEEGRAWARSVLADLRGSGLSPAYDLGDGVIQARLPRGLANATLNRLNGHPRVERVALASDWVPMTMEGFDVASIHRLATGGTYFEPFAGGAFADEIVIIDGAFDLDHPALNELPDVHVYCACGRSTTGSSPGCCQNGGAWQAVGAPSVLYPPHPYPRPAFFHGTSVAAVIRSNVGIALPVKSIETGLPPTQSGPTIHGAANRVTLHLINVQDPSGPAHISNGWNGANIRVSTPGIMEALDRVIGWASTPGRRIRALSMSIGHSPNSCAAAPDYGAFQTKVQTLRNLGVMFIAASGNDVPQAPLSNTIVPGCVPGVMTVAASEHPSRGTRRECHRQDMPPPWLTCYSTIDDNVDIAAPSDMRIPATRYNVKKQFPEQFMANLSGTSFAAPLVAACAAQMASAWPGWNVASAETAMLLSPLLASRCRPGFADCTGTNLQKRPQLQCLQALELARGGGAYLQAGRVGLSGTYYDPATEGQGFLIDVIDLGTSNAQGIRNYFLFASWFTYGPSATNGGRGLRWYSMSGNFIATDTEVPVSIYRSTFATAPVFGQPLSNHVALTIGTGTWRFRSCRQAEFSFHSNELGAPANLPMRTVIVGRDGVTPRCFENNAMEPPVPKGSDGAACVPLFPDQLTGTWERARSDTGAPDPAHAGRGFLIDAVSGSSNKGSTNCAGGRIFGAWYDHAGASDPSATAERFRWASFIGFDAGRLARNDFCLDLNLTHGAARLSPFPDAQWFGFAAQPAPPPGSPQVCPVRLSFSDCNRGTLSYNIGFTNIPGFEGIFGASGSFPIARSVSVSGCTLP